METAQDMATLKALYCSCRCGQVQMQARGRPLETVCCYCGSCQAAGTALSQRAGAVCALRPDGGTEYVLFRKDRVVCTAGQSLLAEHRLKSASPTRRVVATCCNTPMFLDFTRGHLLSVYRASVEPAKRPAVRMRVMAKHRVAAPDDDSTVVNHPAFPPSFAVKLMLAWAAMGFRRPAIDVAGRLEP